MKRLSFPHVPSLLVSVCALAGLVMVPSSAFAGTVCVDPGGGPCQPTIQDGIAAAVSGDTVEVHPGTYTGSITIDKPLTLRGPNAGATLDSVRSAEATLTHGFYISSGDVTIDGFRFTGPDATFHDAKISSNVAVAIDDVAIRSNLIENIAGYGIRHPHNGMGNGAPPAPNLIDQDHRWTITENTIREWTTNNAAAMMLWGIDEAIVHRNRISDTPIGGVTTYALHMSSNSNSEITDNEITGVTSFGLQLAAGWTHVSNVLVSGNTMTNTGTGIILRTDSASYTMSDIRVIENRLTGQELRSIALHQSSLSAISDIEIADNIIEVDAGRLSDGNVIDGVNRPRFVGAIDLPFNDNAATAHGHVDVRGNSVTFSGVTPGLITPIAISVRGEATSVTISGNSFDGGHVAAGAGATSPPSAVMLYVNEPALAGALDPAAVISVVSNTIIGWENALTIKESPAGAVVSPPVGVTVSFTTNLVSDISGYAVETGSSGADVVAEDNAWGCDGLVDSGGGCPISVGRIAATTYLVLSVRAAPASVALNRGPAIIIADLTRNDQGAVVAPMIANGTAVRFATNLGSIPATSNTASGLATAALTPGAVTGTATVTVRAGGLEQTVGVEFTAAIVEPGGTTPGRDTGGGTDNGTKPIVARPRVTRLKLATPKFRVAKIGPSLTTKRAAGGTWLTWSLNRAAPVRMKLVRVVQGRKAGKRCVATTKVNAKRRPCTRKVTMGGVLRAPGKIGTNRIRFTGRYQRKALAPGKYILRVYPVGGAPRVVASASFTVVKPKPKPKKRAPSKRT